MGELKYDIFFNSGASGGFKRGKGNNISLVSVTNSDEQFYQTAEVTLFNEPSSVSLNDTIDVYIDDGTHGYSREFSGYVSRKQTIPKGVKELKLQCMGNTYNLWRFTCSSTCIYSSQTSVYIVSSIVGTYASGDGYWVDTSSLYPASGPIIKEIDFSDYVVGDTLKRLIKFDGYHFHVDNENKLKYYKKSDTKQFITTESDILEINYIEEADEDIVNECLVLGTKQFEEESIHNESTSVNYVLNASNDILAQRFVAEKGTLSAVKVYIDRTTGANIPTWLQGSIYDDNAGEPGSLIAGMDTLNWDSVGVPSPPDWTEYSRPTDGYSLTNNEIYWLVLNCPGGTASKYWTISSKKVGYDIFDFSKDLNYRTYSNPYHESIHFNNYYLTIIDYDESADKMYWYTCSNHYKQISPFWNDYITDLEDIPDAPSLDNFSNSGDVSLFFKMKLYVSSNKCFDSGARYPDEIYPFVGWINQENWYSSYDSTVMNWGFRVQGSSNTKARVQWFSGDPKTAGQYQSGSWYNISTNTELEIKCVLNTIDMYDPNNDFGKSPLLELHVSGSFKESSSALQLTQGSNSFWNSDFSHFHIFDCKSLQRTQTNFSGNSCWGYIDDLQVGYISGLYANDFSSDPSFTMGASNWDVMECDYGGISYDSVNDRVDFDFHCRCYEGKLESTPENGWATASITKLNNIAQPMFTCRLRITTYDNGSNKADKADSLTLAWPGIFFVIGDNGTDDFFGFELNAMDSGSAYDSNIKLIRAREIGSFANGIGGGEWHEIETNVTYNIRVEIDDDDIVLYVNDNEWSRFDTDWNLAEVDINELKFGFQDGFADPDNTCLDVSHIIGWIDNLQIFSKEPNSRICWSSDGGTTWLRRPRRINYRLGWNERNVRGHASSQGSKDTYGTHLMKVEESLLQTDDDAQSYADRVIEEMSGLRIKGNITINGRTDVDITKKIGLFMDNTDISSAVDVNNYVHIIDKDGFKTNIQFGPEPYDIAAKVERLEGEVY